MKYAIVIVSLLSLLTGAAPVAQTYELPVEHLHTLRNCRGTLVITPDGVGYRTGHAEDARQWSYTDIQSIKVTAPRSIEIFTYEDQKRLLGRDRVWKFEASTADIPPEISALLVEKAARPVVTNQLPASSNPPLFAVPVKHRHVIGGCDGVLRIFSDRVTFESSDVAKDSRSWRYRDVDSFAHYERFRLEFVIWGRNSTRSTRTYEFHLKEDLPPAAEAHIRNQLKQRELTVSAEHSAPRINAAPGVLAPEP